MEKKFSNVVEKTGGKGDIAHDEQFLLFLQCFQNNCTTDTYKQGLVLERVNPFPNIPSTGANICKLIP